MGFGRPRGFLPAKPEKLSLNFRMYEIRMPMPVLEVSMKTEPNNTVKCPVCFLVQP